MSISNAFNQLNQIKPQLGQSFMDWLNSQGGFMGEEVNQFIDNPLDFLMQTGFNPIQMTGDAPNQQWLAGRQSMQQPQGGYLAPPPQMMQDPTRTAMATDYGTMQQPAMKFGDGRFRGGEDAPAQDWDDTQPGFTGDTGGVPQPGDADYPDPNAPMGGGQANYTSQGQVPMFQNNLGQATQNPNKLTGQQGNNPNTQQNQPTSGQQGSVQMGQHTMRDYNNDGTINWEDINLYNQQNNLDPTQPTNGNQQNQPLGGGQQGGNNMGLPTGQNLPVPPWSGNTHNFSPFRSMYETPYAPQGYTNAMQNMYGQLSSANDPEEINARTQSIMALSNLPLQQYFQGAYPQVMGNLSDMYNQQQDRLQNAPKMLNSTQRQQAPNVPNQMNTAMNNAGNLSSNIYNSQRPNVGSFNQYNQGFQGAQNKANNMNADIEDAQFTEIGNNLGNMQTSVQGANTSTLDSARNGMNLGDVGRSFTPQVEQGVRDLSNFQAPQAMGSYQQQAINQLQNAQPLSLPQNLQYEGAIDSGLANVAEAGNRLVNESNLSPTLSGLDTSSLMNNPNYQSAMSAITGDVNESFAEQERQLESSLAASGMSNSTMANEQRKRLADQKARALANANLQAMQIVGGERRADMGTAASLQDTLFNQQMGVQGSRRADLGSAQSALGALQDAQLQQGQFDSANQLAGSQDAQSRAGLLSGMLGNRFSEDVAGEQLAMQGNAESRANLGMQAGIADQYFNQAMQNRGLGLDQLSLLDQLANNELGRNVTQAGFGNQANLDQAQTRLGMQNAQIQQALAEGQITSDQANTLMNIANSQVGAEQAGRSFDLQTDQQGFQQALAQAGLKREDIDRLAQLAQTQYGMDMSNAGFNASEDQRAYDNYANTMLQNENIYNNRYSQTQQPLTQLLSALSGVNVAPNVLGNLQMPQQGPSTGEVAGQFVGSTIANLLPIPFMPRG